MRVKILTIQSVVKIDFMHTLTFVFRFFTQLYRYSILRYECDKVLFRRMRSLSPERSEGDNRIRHDKTFMHECRMLFYNTSHGVL